jgi:hypothetical protein
MLKQRVRSTSIKISQGTMIVQPTGEFVKVDSGTYKITQQILTDKHFVSSYNYNYIDTDAIKKLQNFRTNVSLQSAVGFLLALSDNLDFHTNIIIDDGGEPYNVKSIAAIMNCTIKSVYNKLKILEDNKLIVVYKTDIIKFKNIKVISINPTFIRRGKDFYTSLVHKFPDLTLDPPNISQTENGVLFKNRGAY